MSHLEEAFFTVCANAQQVKGNYVSLYINEPFYGGAEEGGWWGSDTFLCASEWCATQEEAEAKLEAVKQLAKQLNKEAKDAFNQQCRDELDAADARGVDYDTLREVDGEMTYWVCSEETKGEHISRGERQWS